MFDDDNTGLSGLWWLVVTVVGSNGGLVELILVVFL